MFQIEKMEVLTSAGAQTGVKLTFSSGETVQVLFSEIPSDRTTAGEKAEWLKSRLNELLTVGTRPDGSPVQHYRANVVPVSESPFAVGFAFEAV